ncbi:hypothetical protein VTN96DRAFT_4676 [Rasamsonia emersonii]
MPRDFESDKHVTLSDNESDARTDLPDIFSNNPSNDSSDSDTEPNRDDSDDDSDDSSDDDAFYDDEEQHPPEYYLLLATLSHLAEADRLDVSQLRQQRYSPKTQKKLEETRDY